MQAERNPRRRSRAGGLVVTADDLIVGDRLELEGATRALFFPIVAIDEKPKTRIIKVSLGQFSEQTFTMRRTTLTARGLRPDEIAEDDREADEERRTAYEAWKAGGSTTRSDLDDLDLRAAAQHAQAIGDHDTERQIDSILLVREARR